MEDTEPTVQVPLLNNERPTKKKIYLDTNIFDTYLLFWVDKILRIGKKKAFQQDMHYDLRKEDSSEEIVTRLSQKFQEYKYRKEPLFKALVSTTKFIFLRAIICTLFGGVLQYAGPLLIKYIINYIQDGNRDLKTGILLVAGVVASRVLITIFSARAQILLTIMGINTSKAINGIIYEKSLKFSLIRSADHSQGSLVNHIQVDSEKLYYLGLALGGVITLPILIAAGVFLMYSAVGISFLSGIGVIFIMGLINFAVGKKYFVAQKAVMTKKDDRMKLATEILSGIKYIKMSGWEEAFLDKISTAREDELKGLKTQYNVICFSIFFLWLTPMLITVAIFATFIFTGNPMNAKAAFTLVSTLMILQQPLRALPFIITLILESKVAMNRVTKFLLAEEVRLDNIKRGNPSDSKTAIKISHGSFYWLTEEEKKMKKEREEEDEKAKKDAKYAKKLAQERKKKEELKRKEEKAKKLEEEKIKKQEKKNKKNKIKDETSNLKTESIVISSQNPQINLEEPIKDSEQSLAVDNARDSVGTAESSGYRLVLDDVNLEIKRGSFVAILGDVGSGKSSLLYSMIGEMKFDGENPPQLEVNGSISFVSQQPWILNATVKNNITFGQDFHENKYQEAIKFSCLQSDLDILVKKDETEIGEKGVNLSGGQKARISLARALYRDTDIYLLDDPLSAVDAHVGNFILNECFMNYLKDRTRVLVTHKFESLKHADYIYIFKKGRVVEEGTLQSLKDSSIFQEIEEKYRMKANESDGVDEPMEKDQTLLKKENVLNEKDEEVKQPEPDSEPSQMILVTEQKATAPETIKERQDLQKPPVEDESEVKELQEKLMLDEDREIGTVEWKVWKSYFNYYGGWFYFFLVFLVMFIWITLQTCSNFWLSYWSDNADYTTHSDVYYFEIYSALGLSYALFCFIRTWMLFVQSIKCSRQIHKDMLSRIVRAPVNLFFDRVPTGRLLNRLSKDLAVLDSYIATSFGYSLVTIYSLLSDIVVCLIVGTIWVFPLVVLFFYVSYRIQKRFMRVNREVVRLESISKSPIVSFFSESLAGLTSIRAYQESPKFMSRFHELQDANIKNLILSGGLLNWFDLRVTFCTIFVIIPTLAVPILINNNTAMAPGMVGLLITYVIQINDDIINLLWALSTFESKLISLERCKAFTQIQTEAIAHVADTAAIENYQSGWPTRGKIEFVNYSVQYRANLPFVIKDLDITINHGEKIGIVGRTGSGKSTLFLSLLRIIESNSGKICIDDVDISQLGLDDLRRKITIIPQDPMLFKGTLRSNLDLLNRYTDEQLWTSLENVCMKEKFEQESGLTTEIKEGGENFSAGEKQLICIGRAILAQPKIILIDEATSNIDPNTEQTILTTIKNSFKECTVITVAHRLKTIINSDRILVMGQGRKLEFDSPDVLLSNDQGDFYKLWKEHEKARESHDE